MAKKFLTSINLNKNELQNALLHPLASAPSSPGLSQIYFNSGDDKLYIYDGSQWLDITGNVVGITSNTPALTIDNTDPSNPALAIADANGTNPGLLSSALYDLLTNATHLATGDTLVKRDVNGDALFNNISATSMDIGGNSVATEQYVNTIVASGMKVKGAIDASTDPNYPSAVVGDAYHISVAGNIGGASGEAVEIGDMVLCIADNAGGDHATVGSDWIVLQENVDQATETVIGLARIATTAEVTAGSNNEAYITPAKLAAALAGLGGGNANKFVTTVGDGTNTLYTVNHALGEQYCQVQLFDTTSNEEVIADIELTDANNCTVTFSIAPTTNQYRVVVIG